MAEWRKNIWAAVMLLFAAVLPQAARADIIIPGDIAAGAAGTIPAVYSTHGSAPHTLSMNASSGILGGGLCIGLGTIGSCALATGPYDHYWTWLPEISKWGIEIGQTMRFFLIPHGTLSWTPAGTQGWAPEGNTPYSGSVTPIAGVIDPTNRSTPLIAGNSNTLSCTNNVGSDTWSDPKGVFISVNAPVLVGRTVNRPSCSSVVLQNEPVIPSTGVPGTVAGDVTYDLYIRAGNPFTVSEIAPVGPLTVGVYDATSSSVPWEPFPPIVTTSLSCAISITANAGGNYTTRTVNIPNFAARGNNLPAVGDGPGLAAHNLGSSVPVYGQLTTPSSTLWNVDCGNTVNNSGSTRTVGAYVHPAGASVGYPGTKGIWDPAHKAYYLVGGFSSTPPSTTSFCPDNGNVNLSGQQIPLVTIPSGKGRTGSPFIPASTWPIPQPSPNFYVQLCATGQTDDDYGTHSIPFVFSSYMN